MAGNQKSVLFIQHRLARYKTNPGEELVGSYLREICDCDFVEFNLRTRFTQGEIDVVDINTAIKTVYLCEVANHLRLDFGM